MSAVRQTWDGQRFYAHPVTGHELPSVTTIESVLPKPWFGPWAAKAERALCLQTARIVYGSLGDEHVSLDEFTKRLEMALPKKKAHKIQSDEATDIGKEGHALIEWRLRGELGLPRPEKEPEVSEPARWVVLGFEDVRKEMNLEPLQTELFLYSDRQKLDCAGTTDLIANVSIHVLAPKKRRVRALIDIKSAKAVYREHAVQVATYRQMAIEMGLLDEKDWGMILRLPKKLDDTVEAVPIQPSRCRELVEVHRACRVIWDWSKQKGQV